MHHKYLEKAMSGLLIALGAANVSATVLVDSFRGQTLVPSPAITPNYNNDVAPGSSTDRFNGVQRLLTFAGTPANRAAAVSGTSLVSTWPSLEIPSGSDMLCESASGTGNACQNRIQGAVLYTALLMPAQGNYTLVCEPGGNDGTIVDLAPTQGTDYRNLAYSSPVAAFCTIDPAQNPYGTTGVMSSPTANTLVNLRLAWNNWGNDASMVIYWQPPGGGPAVPIPPGNLYDPSAPSTYLTADDDNFSGAPFTSGVGGSTATVFSNDRVNVATPVSAGAGGTAANIQTYQLIPDSGGNPPPSGMTLNADGSLSVASSVPAGDYVVRYQICRTDTLPNPLCAAANITIKVNAPVVIPPTPPVISDASFTTSANTPVSGNASTGGQVPPDSVFQVVTPPAHGQLTIDPVTGAFTYTPSASYTGTDTATVRVCLPAPNSTVCDDAVLTFTVQGGGGGSSATPVPTLSEWTLIGLATLTALFGFGQLRRRQS